MRLEDTKFIVTGGAQGLGRHFALRIAEAGGQVAAGDVKEAGLASLAEEAKALTGRVHTRRLDVADEADVASFVEFAPFGIRVGAIAPGMVETPMTQGMNQKARDAYVAAIPVGRIGVPEDIWLSVKFIIECEYFNGRTIDVDGGLGI
jgi:NAD(P)-dependent dehydrogenase (short-subunit alcohol dehydrogenase family)